MLGGTSTGTSTGTGTATPPLAGHVWGVGGATGAQVLKAGLAKVAGEKTAHEEGDANGEVQKEVEIAA